MIYHVATLFPTMQRTREASNSIDTRVLGVKKQRVGDLQRDGREELEKISRQICSKDLRTSPNISGVLKYRKWRES